MLTLWRAHGESVVATGMGASAAEATTSAAQALLKLAPDGKGRLEIDVPIGIHDVDLTIDVPERVPELGTDGLLVARDDGKVGWVTPSEIVVRRLFHEGSSPGLERGKVRALLASRAGVSDPDLDSMRAYRVSMDAHVEPDTATPGAPPLALVRGMVTPPTDASPDRLVAAVRRGADYLVRITNADGRFVYLYKPLEDHDEASYGWLRHAGTTYAIFEAYEELRTQAYADAGERAIRYLEAHLQNDPDSNGKYLVDSHDEEQQKVGGAGIALVAFAKHASTTGKRDHLDTMRALARFILKQQYADGHFKANADVEQPGQKLKKEVVYYVGEATLGLMRLYALDPQPAYLDAARRSANFVVDVRDAPVSEDNQEHDHWMTYALNEVFRVTRDARYLEHAYKIARAIEKKQHLSRDPSPDLFGTFYDGLTTPAATRLEALDADIAASRFAGKPTDWLTASAVPIALHTLGQQYTADDDYWVKNPTKAEGGVRESLLVADVEIDYVQHAMSAWLHLARLERDAEYGKTGVPCQDPVR